MVSEGDSGANGLLEELLEEFSLSILVREEEVVFGSVLSVSLVIASASEVLFKSTVPLVFALNVLEGTGGEEGNGRMAVAFCLLGLLLPLLLLVAEEESEPVRRDSQCLPSTSCNVCTLTKHLLDNMEAISIMPKRTSTGPKQTNLREVNKMIQIQNFIKGSFF